jgi:hypothetical protein
MMKRKSLIATALLTSGLLLGTTAVAIADETPAPTATPSAYQTQLAAYKIALTQYRVTLVNNDINYRAALEKYETDWQATVKSYWAAWQSAIAVYQTANTAYQGQLAPIKAARKSALDAADSAFLAATAGTPTNDQLNAALSAYWNAAKVANTAYKSAVAALGAAPVRPIQPPLPTKPTAPVKPVDPTKPVAPAKNK